jgi:hypothetical protein
MLDSISPELLKQISLIYLGSVCTQLLSLNEFRGTVPFFENFFPNRSDAFYYRLNFLILPLVGTFLALYLLDPKGVYQSVFAGLSWSGSLIALLKKPKIIEQNVNQ